MIIAINRIQISHNHHNKKRENGIIRTAEIKIAY